MVFANVFVIALALAIPDGAALSSNSGSDAGRADQVVHIQCTTVLLEYLDSGSTKNTYSENCSNSDSAKHPHDLDEHENLSNVEIDEE